VEVIYMLVPLALVLVALIIWVFLWSVRSGQFDDLEGPAHRILMDDDDIGSGIVKKSDKKS
jgi:cbb3-type cytochrome oxidase maturation protein